MSNLPGYRDLQQPLGDYGDGGLEGAEYGPSQTAGSPYGRNTLAYADTDERGGGGGGAGGGSNTQQPVQIPSPYPLPDDPGLENAATGSKLFKSFTELSKKKDFSHLKLALVDLTGVDESSKAPYVGYKDNELTLVASMAKIALILPAFALREAARAAATVLMPPLTPDAFFKRLETAWAVEFTRGFRKGTARDTKPKLRAILSARFVSATKPLKVNFTIQQNRNIAKAGFFPMLGLALGRSVNEAAARCINDIGYPFIHEAHRAAAIDGKDGLMLTMDYASARNNWEPTWPKNEQREHLTARWVAELLIRIARDRLIKKGLAYDMQDVMSDELPDLAEGVWNQISAVERENLSRKGKIGYLDDKPFADCAIVRRTSAKGTQLIYVAVALGGNSHAEIRLAGAALDDCILAAHGEPLKPPLASP